MFLTSFGIIAQEKSLNKEAERVLSLINFKTSDAPSVIGEREWQDLQLDRLITIFDRTTTSFGRWGLNQLLDPIIDKQELLRRQHIIQFLIEHEDVMKLLQEQLTLIHDLEKSLLSYWDKHDWLTARAKSFYYTLPLFTELNKNSIALDAGVAVDMLSAWKYLLGSLALMGVTKEITRWVYSEQEGINIFRGFKEGLEGPISQHSPYRHQLSEDQNPPYTHKEYVKAFAFQGSWGDRYAIMQPSIGKIGAFLAASLPTLFFDYQWSSTIYSAGQYILSTYRTLNMLQIRVSNVAHCIKAIKKLRTVIVEQCPEIMHYFDHDYEGNDKIFINNLLSQRFLQKPGYLYSRGHVLAMHLKISQKKNRLIPLLQSVALLDAYCSTAQLYKQCVADGAQFCFPEFVESPQPLLNYRDAWLPLLSSSKAIANDLVLGGSVPGKIIITGPSGSGKSTILKAYGIIAVLAQSGFPVSARECQQTIFSTIQTSFASREDLEGDLSSFMAEQKVMMELLDDIRYAEPNEKLLVLIDEPYKGIVEAESARRIYQFGKDIAVRNQALVVIATHVQKPIMLENDTNGAFGNYQVKIEEPSLGVFKRLFKLEKGPALWWLQDEDKRGRFVDWLAMLK